jgi:hypothetical protein
MEIAEPVGFRKTPPSLARIRRPPDGGLGAQR